MSADPEDGQWCRQCKRRHGYMTMKVEFEKDKTGLWHTLWLCPVYFTVLGSTSSGKEESGEEGA
jgi:hypothetical protein